MYVCIINTTLLTRIRNCDFSWGKKNIYILPDLLEYEIDQSMIRKNMNMIRKKVDRLIKKLKMGEKTKNKKQTK